MNIAVISDIYGNIAALDAVLADAATRQVDRVVNLGYICSGGLFQEETADRLMPLGFPTRGCRNECAVNNASPEGLKRRSAAPDPLQTFDVPRDCLVADLGTTALNIPMTVKRVIVAFLIGLLGLFISFFLTNVILLAWYANAYPHDGQTGLAAFVWGLYVAPPCGIAAFMLSLMISRKQRGI